MRKSDSQQGETGASMKKISLLLLLVLSLMAGVGIWSVVTRLNDQVTTRFEGRRWELPARIFGRPLELYVGRELLADELQQELDLLQYAATASVAKPGEFRRTGNSFTVHSRDVPFPEGLQTAAIVNIKITDGRVTDLSDGQSLRQLDLFRLEPLLIASIYPGDNEDRLFVRLSEVPHLFSETLLLTEDKKFYQHAGIRPLAILRALLANIKAGRTVQGGSTLTQQLVKNFFLSSEQSIGRKLNEAVMALLLEYHYSKEDILESYLNEIYLGQDGKRAIHGFGLASRFYFERNIEELSPDQIALLVGMAKGASFYNPRRHPERAISRRNLILREMGESGLLSMVEVQNLQKRPLGIREGVPSGITHYPAFVQLVRRQLKRDYRDEDLQSEGLSIFTTFDPVFQMQAESGLQKVLADIELQRNLTKGKLQGVFVLCSAEQGEVLAVVAGRNPRQAGFNRALDMRRPVGSIIKPAVYLTALSQPGKYNLLTTLYDEPLRIPVQGGSAWEPENYGREFYGPVSLLTALAESYNVATVQLGMEIGVDAVVKTLHSLGVDEEIAPYPSLLLGAVELPPLTVLQMYQTIAAGGYRTPLRTILAVTDMQNTLLQRYPLRVEQVVKSGPLFCLSRGLVEVCRSGTGRNLLNLLPLSLSVAGKTGTTDQLRDSWFAGFSGSHVAVAWVGRDDNKSTNLTGASGAMRVWAAVMSQIRTTALELQSPESIEFYYSDVVGRNLYADRCESGELLPYVRDGILPAVVPCGSRGLPAEGMRTREDRYERVPQSTIQKLLRIFQ